MPHCFSLKPGRGSSLEGRLRGFLVLSLIAGALLLVASGGRRPAMTSAAPRVGPQLSAAVDGALLLCGRDEFSSDVYAVHGGRLLRRTRSPPGLGVAHLAAAGSRI